LAHPFEVCLAAMYLVLGAAFCAGRVASWWLSASTLAVLPLYPTILMAAAFLVGGGLILCGLLLSGDPQDSTVAWMKERLGLVAATAGWLIYLWLWVVYYQETFLTLAPPVAAIAAHVLRIVALERVEEWAVRRQTERGDT
jgi:hypothetical protein